MDNHESYAKTWHRIFLFVGVFSILSGIALLIIFSQKVYFTASIILDFAFILVGFIFFYFAYFNKSHIWRYFLGLSFSLAGLILLLIESYFVDYEFYKFWPVLVSLAGINLLLSAIFTKKRITISLFIPSIFLIFMGIVFLFFSLEIVKKSFVSVFVNFIPWFFIISGIILFCSFFYVQSGRHIAHEFIEDNDEE